jgi:hypothetical protein
MARAPTTASAASTQKSIASIHSPLSLAVGYNSVVTHGRRSCNNVVAILAKDKTPSLCSRCCTPVLRDSGLCVTMPGGGTRLGEEVRDGPYGDNRRGGNRSGVAPAAAPLRSQAGLYNALGRAFLDSLLGGAAFALPRPDALSPPPLCPCGGLIRGSGLFVFSNGIQIEIKSARALAMRP